LDSASAEARGGKKEAMKEVEILKKAKEMLARGEMLQVLKNEPAIKGLQLLTAKPQIYLLNGKPEDVSEELKNKITALGAVFIVADLGAAKDVNELVKEAYKILGLISFFTTGEDETRAWTIEAGSKASQAAGAIHTDFERKFIRAEVINWQKLLEAKSWTLARQKGWIRTEGKEYIFQDGDVAEFKHG
jgi:ribosome-binding ATPase YchF (GTP1/OBG family)